MVVERIEGRRVKEETGGRVHNKRKGYRRKGYRVQRFEWSWVGGMQENISCQGEGNGSTANYFLLHPQISQNRNVLHNFAPS